MSSPSSVQQPKEGCHCSAPQDYLDLQGAVTAPVKQTKNPCNMKIAAWIACIYKIVYIKLYI